jgi:hypothetical protein
VLAAGEEADVIPSPNHSTRGGAKVRLVVIHTAEGARTAAELGAYFAKASVQASSHVGIDDGAIEQYVDYGQEAWTVRSGNPISDNAELCGFAAWTRDQWLTQHQGMLRLAATWIRDRCTAHGIPIRKLTPAQVAAGQAGVCGHVDWTLGMHDGTHTDPGPGFPWDVVIAMATGTTSPTATAPEGDDAVVTPIELTYYDDNWKVDPNGLNFRASVPAEVANNSAVISRAWVRWVAYWGKVTWKIVAWGAARPISEATYTTDNWELPPSTRGFTVEGRRDAPGTIPAASLLTLPK